MGRTLENFMVSCSLDSHGGPQDRIDEESFEELKKDIQKLIDETPKYTDIRAMVC